MKKQIEITTERNFPVSKNFERKVKNWNTELKK